MLHFDKMKFLPNGLSIFRILSAFFIIALSSQNNEILSLLALLLFIFASLSDYLDGYLARKYRVMSQLGAALDLLADKILVSIMLIWLTYAINTLEIFVLSIILISRELAMSTLRQMKVKETSDTLKVNYLGKVKTFSQMTAISFLLCTPTFSLGTEFIYDLGVILLGFAGFMSLTSFFQYLKKI